MFRSLHLENFKCFDSLDLPLAPFTLLSGTNSGGKSSVIQSLVLLSQTLRQREFGRALVLNSDDLALGSVSDVLNQRASSRTLVLGATAGDQRVAWKFRAQDRRALAIDLEAVEVDGKTVATESLRWLLPPAMAADSPVVAALRRLSWITAERTGPRELLPLHDTEGHAHVGPRGELAAGLLHWREFDNVLPALCKAGVPPTLRHQVRARMQEFFPGCDLRVTPIEGASAVALQLRSDTRSDFQRPQNVGFGVTQLFPVLVAVLAARAGDVLVIENPEVHLHPKAQQEIGTLLAGVAASGIQVVVETHSDHVLNGIRLAVKTKRIDRTQVLIHFFAPGQAGGTFVPQSPVIDADGRLDSWPEGFFDQIDAALSQML